jgi:hypothetical protein
MPVSRFNSAFDIPRPDRYDGPDLLQHIRILWNRAFALSSPSFTRGVTRFATIEDANRARFDATVARMRRTSSPDRPQAPAEDGTRGKLAASERQGDPNVEPAGGQDGG